MESSTRLPSGVGLHPTDKELVGFYVYRTNTGGDFLPFDRNLVKDYDLHSEDPSEIWLKFGGEELQPDEDLFFFTKLKKMNAKVSIIDGKIGMNGGTWHGEDCGIDVKLEIRMDGGIKQIINAKKRRFNCRNSEYDQHGLWIMQDYGLLDAPNCEYVVCRLRKTVSGASCGERTKRVGFDNEENPAKRRMVEKVDEYKCPLMSEFVDNENQQGLQHVSCADNKVPEIEPLTNCKNLECSASGIDFQCGLKQSWIKKPNQNKEAEATVEMSLSSTVCECLTLDYESVFPNDNTSIWISIDELLGEGENTETVDIVKNSSFDYSKCNV